MTVGVVLVVPDPWGGDIAVIRAGYGDPRAHDIPTHITLLPPTRMPVLDYAPVEQHLQGIATQHAAIDVVLRGTRTFRPVSNVVFLALERGGPECSALAAAVTSGPVQTRSPYPFHPHVTLAHDVADDVLDHAQREHADFRGSFSVPHLSLLTLDDDDNWRTRSRLPLSVQRQLLG